MSTYRERVHDLFEWGMRTAETLQRWVERTIFWQVWERLLENEFVDRSVALASKAFVSLFPDDHRARVVRAALDPRLDLRRRSRGTSASKAADWTRSRARSRSPTTSRRRPGSSASCSRSSSSPRSRPRSARVYVKAWRRPKAGRVSAYAVGLTWLVGVDRLLHPDRRPPRRFSAGDRRPRVFAVFALARRGRRVVAHAVADAPTAGAAPGARADRDHHRRRAGASTQRRPPCGCRARSRRTRASSASSGSRCRW